MTCPANHVHAGSNNCYKKHHCRCEECVAHHEHMLATPCPPTHKHGQSSVCYANHRCRCKECVEAAAERRAVLRDAGEGCPDDHKHGETTTCYAHHGCRCKNCVDAHVSRQGPTYTERYVVAGTCPPEHKHGETGTCYQAHKCRCLDCTKANASRIAEYRTTTDKRYVNKRRGGTGIRTHVHTVEETPDVVIVRDLVKRYAREGRSEILAILGIEEEPAS